MTTKEVAARFYELAQQNQWNQIQDELYSQDVMTIEPEGSEWASGQGMEVVKEKAAQMNESVEEMHGGWCSEPQVGGDYFSVAMGMDVTMKGQPRMSMDEVCVYKVQDGKIVSEQFFYSM